MRKGWEYKKLGEVCCPKSKIQRATKCFGASDEISYIDISSIDNSVQEVNSITSFTMSNAPSRAQQKVEYGDIIVSTVRPNLKNVAFIKQHDSNLVASSGFCVLRTTDDIVRNYLFRYITSDIFTQHLMKLTTGANYPAVRDLDVRDSIIPLPPLSTQLSIVSELDKINELIRLKKEQLKDFDNLAQSIFYEMFGDPVENERGWEVKKLGDVCSIGTGSTPNRKNKDFYENGTYPWVKSTEVCNRPIYSVEEAITEEAIKNSNCTLYPKNTILMAMYGQGKTRGQIGLLKIKACTNQAVAAIIPKKEVNDEIFLYKHLILMYEHIRNMARGGNQANLNLSIVKSIQIILPPLPLQHLFAQRIEQIEHQKTEVQKSITDLETLLASRMQYWFE